MKVREILVCNRHATIASALEGNLRVIECKWDSESEFLIMPIFDVVYNKTFICKPYVDSLIFHQIAVCSIATEVLASSRQSSRKVSLQGGKVEAGTIKATWNAAECFRRIGSSSHVPVAGTYLKILSEIPSPVHFVLNTVPPTTSRVPSSSTLAAFPIGVGKGVPCLHDPLPMLYISVSDVYWPFLRPRL